MYIKKITLNNFRNYEKEEIEFVDNINIIYGNNAQGKTNIIEAIYLCAYGKSFRAKKDSDLIRFNEKEANAEIEFFKVDRNKKIPPYIEFFLIFNFEPCILWKKTESIKT